MKLKLPKRRRPLSEWGWNRYVEETFNLNKDYLSENIPGSLPALTKFKDLVKEARERLTKEYRHTRKQVTVKNTLEHLMDTRTFSTELELGQKNIAKALKNTKTDKKLLELIGKKRISTDNITYDEEEKTFKYRYQTEEQKKINKKNKKKEYSYITINLDNYNKKGYHAISFS